MAVSERALSASDREILRPYSTADAKRGNFITFSWMSLMMFAALVVAVGLLWDFLSWLFSWPGFEAVKWWLFGSSALASFGVTGRWAYEEQKLIRSTKGLAALADEDLKNGIAVVEHLDVVAVSEVEEVEDEGAGFLMELKDGRVLFLLGQHLYPFSLNADSKERAEAKGNVFPSNKLDFSYAPKSGLVLDAAGKGSYLRPRSWARWQGDGPRSKHYNGPIPDSFNEGPLDELMERCGFLEVPV